MGFCLRVLLGLSASFMDRSPFGNKKGPPGVGVPVCRGVSGGPEIAPSIYNVFVWSELSEVSPELAEGGGVHFVLNLIKKLL